MVCEDGQGKSVQFPNGWILSSVIFLFSILSTLKISHEPRQGTGPLGRWRQKDQEFKANRVCMRPCLRKPATKKVNKSISAVTVCGDFEVKLPGKITSFFPLFLYVQPVIVHISHWDRQHVNHVSDCACLINFD